MQYNIIIINNIYKWIISNIAILKNTIKKKILKIQKFKFNLVIYLLLLIL